MDGETNEEIALKIKAKEFVNNLSEEELEKLSKEPKEKAKELFDLFFQVSANIDRLHAVLCVMTLASEAMLEAHKTKQEDRIIFWFLVRKEVLNF